MLFYGVLAAKQPSLFCDNEEMARSLLTYLLQDNDLYRPQGGVEIDSEWSDFRQGLFISSYF
jgi:hypothetical protein